MSDKDPNITPITAELKQRVTEIASGSGEVTFSVAGVVEDYLTAYAIEIITSLFPSPIDGLKLVQRRMLWQNRDNKELSTSTVPVSETLKVHPYGDTSIYDVLCRMSQQWCTNPPLMYLKGITGSYSGKSPAAARYTKSQVAKIAKDLFFDGVDVTAIPKYRGITNEFEPQYLVPKIPTALVYDCLSIGFGYQSRTVSFSFENVCLLVSAFAQHMDKSPTQPFDYRKHIKKFTPDLPSPCILINEEEVLKEYMKGNWCATLCMDGRVVLSHNQIVVQSTPHHTAFGELKEAVENAIRDKTTGFDAIVDRVDSLSRDPTIGALTINLKRGVNVFDAWDTIRTVVKNYGTLSSIPNYGLPNGRISSIDPINVMRNWFLARRALVLSSKRRSVQSITSNIWIAKALELVIPHRDRVIDIVKNNSREKAIEIFCDELKTTYRQAEAILGMRLEYISKITGQELTERRKKLEADLAKVNESFRNVNTEISDVALALKKSYPVERSMHIPMYIGTVSIGESGYEQFESIEEALLIADRFPKGKISFHMFDGKAHRALIGLDGRPKQFINHKYGKGEIHSFSLSPKSLYTVAIEDGAACAVKGVQYGLREKGWFYTTQHAIGLTRDGRAAHINIPHDISMRKTVCRGANSDYIYVFSKPTDKEGFYYVASCYSHDKNAITIKRMKVSDTRVGLSPLGDVWLAHSYTGKEWFLNVPQDFINRQAVRAFYIPDAESILKGKDMVRLDIATAAVKRSSAITYIV